MINDEVARFVRQLQQKKMLWCVSAHCYICVAINNKARHKRLCFMPMNLENSNHFNYIERKLKTFVSIVLKSSQSCTLCLQLQGIARYMEHLWFLAQIVELVQIRKLKNILITLPTIVLMKKIALITNLCQLLKGSYLTTKESDYIQYVWRVE